MKNDAAWESRIVFRLTQIGRTDTKFVFKTFSEVAGCLSASDSHDSV